MSTQTASSAPKLSSTEQFVFDKPLIAPQEKVLLSMAFPDYAYGRCYKHGIIGLPDADKAIRASGKITCPNPQCVATTVLIADPTAYVQSHSIPKLSFQEIMDRLKAEGISKKDFVRHLQQPDWLGYVQIIEEQANYKTKHECESHSMLYGLPEHVLYIHAKGTKENVEGRSNKKWLYEFHEVAEDKVSATAEFMSTYRPL
jgi:hypothetical protein